MGVYIKDMQMPKTCGECVFIAWKRGVGQYCTINNKITFHVTLDDFDVGYKRNGTCPLVPIPPHGRLIDADALENEVQMRLLECNKYGNQFQRPYEVLRAIALAPTIIPASKEV